MKPYKPHKNDKLHIPMTSEEKDFIRQKAQKASVTISDYCRYLLLNADIAIKVKDTRD